MQHLGRLAGRAAFEADSRRHARNHIVSDAALLETVNQAPRLVFERSGQECRSCRGDAQWTVMAFLSWGVALPRASAARVAALALATSFAVECSQLVLADWLSAVRATALGRLALGKMFHAADFVAYAVGPGLAAGLE